MIVLPADAPAGPVIAHTDAVRTRMLVPGKHDRAGYLAAHENAIAGIADGRTVWFPSFNYDFLRTGRYSVADDKVQVGSINEFVRTVRATWRSTTPVFNFVGNGEPPVPRKPVDGHLFPFDESSVFGQAVERDGTVLWYGAPFSSATILHHAESRSGGPLYRFDKDFAGSIIDAAGSTQVSMRYHVRPRDRHLDYDWDRMFAQASEEGILRQFDSELPVYWASARSLVDSWVAQLTRDPLALLDAPSRQWVEPELDRLGRRFERADFEGVDA